jgi:hypothetical protein
MFAVAALILALPACRREQPALQPEEPAQVTAAKPFSPPADSLIAIEQMQRWIACNPLLDSLSFLYQDSFSVDDPSVRLKHQENFVSAQSRLCIRRGLKGGYDEYLWILRNAGHSRNKRVLDSLGLKSL